MCDSYSGKIITKGKTGSFCLGQPHELVQHYILPGSFSDVISLGPNPIIVYKNKTVGKVVNFKIQDGNVLYLLLKFNSDFGNINSWATVTLSTLFSTKVNNNYLLDEIIVEKLEINQLEN